MKENLTQSVSTLTLMQPRRLSLVTVVCLVGLVTSFLLFTSLHSVGFGSFLIFMFPALLSSFFVKSWKEVRLYSVNVIVTWCMVVYSAFIFSPKILILALPIVMSSSLFFVFAKPDSVNRIIGAGKILPVYVLIFVVIWNFFIPYSFVINGGNFGASCFPPVLVTKKEVEVKHLGGISTKHILELPVNREDFQKYCRQTWIE